MTRSPTLSGAQNERPQTCSIDDTPRIGVDVVNNFGNAGRRDRSDDADATLKRSDPREAVAKKGER